MKNQIFLCENFQFFRGEIFCLFEQACFRNAATDLAIQKDMRYSHNDILGIVFY